VFEPAIRRTGLRPNRVDLDPSVSIPIADIETGIRDAAICFAEITTDSPNVWFELGFAIACGKDTVMVCSRERKKYPFDVQHRHVIPYDTKKRGFESALCDEVAKRLRARLDKTKAAKRAAGPNPPTRSASLHYNEQAALVVAADICRTKEWADRAAIELGMKSSGVASDLEVNTSVDSVVAKGLLKPAKRADPSGQEMRCYRPTADGSAWLTEHQNEIRRVHENRKTGKIRDLD
jgi:hypothetical protein